MFFILFNYMDFMRKKIKKLEKKTNYYKIDDDQVKENCEQITNSLTNRDWKALIAKNEISPRNRKKDYEITSDCIGMLNIWGFGEQLLSQFRDG